jgi:hypothetical protein
MSTRDIDRDEMSKFGSYTYQKSDAHGNRKPLVRDDYIHAEPIFRYRRHLFQIRYVDDDGAVLVFPDPQNLASFLPIPDSFTLFIGIRQIHPNPVNPNHFVIFWLNDYKLKYRGTSIWKLTRQKQQAVSSTTNKKEKHQVAKLKPKLNDTKGIVA